MSGVADAERELEEFLSSLPAYKRKVFELYTTPITTEECDQLFAESLRQAGQDGQDDQLTERYMQLLERIPEKAKWYKKRHKEIFGAFSPGMPMPKIKRGRKPNEKLAARIVSLHDSGKTSPEIQKILEAEGENLTLEAVEAYLKTRRRKAKQ